MWRDALQELRERGAQLEGERRDELLRVDPRRRPFAAKIYLPLLRKTMFGLEMGGSEWVDQFLAGFAIIGPVSEGGVYPRKGGPSPPIPRPELLAGAPERCGARMLSRISPFDSRLREEALAQKGTGWLEGPFAIPRDAILERGGTKTKWGPAFRPGAPQGEKLRAVDDLNQGWTNRAAHVFAPINLPTRDYFSSTIKLVIKNALSCPLGSAKADRSDAYRQLPLRPDQRELAAFTLRDPSSVEWNNFSRTRSCSGAPQLSSNIFVSAVLLPL